MKDRKRAAKAAYITQYMLELYHLNAVTEKERKLIKEALANDNDVRLRYEELKRLDRDIKSKYGLNSPPVFTVIKNNDNNIKGNRKNKNALIILGIAAAVLCLCIPAFLYFYNKNIEFNTEIAADETEQNNSEEERQIIVIDDININTENERIVVLPNETKEAEIIIKENKIAREVEPVVIAEVSNNETGVYVRGGSGKAEQEQDTVPDQNILTIPPGINFIFDSMFANRGLTDIILPERITLISDNAFANNQIRNILIPENVTSIGSGAFSNNPLISVTIGTNVYIEDDAFPANFAYFYNVYGKTSGTYTRSDISSNEWSKQ